MSRDMRGLKRVAKVYGLVERMRAAELGASTLALAAVEGQGRIERMNREEQVRTGRAALLLGDQEQWLLAAAHQRAADVRGRQLERMRREHVRTRDAALEVHRVSRQDQKQVEQAIQDREAAALVESGRRAQAASDDRYLSRLLWSKERTGGG